MVEAPTRTVFFFFSSQTSVKHRATQERTKEPNVPHFLIEIMWQLCWLRWLCWLR